MKPSSPKNLIISPGCISCGACEFVAPAIFEVTDVSRVRTDAEVAAHRAAIEEAILLCPVNVIAYETPQE